MVEREKERERERKGEGGQREKIGPARNGSGNSQPPLKREEAPGVGQLDQATSLSCRQRRPLVMLRPRVRLLGKLRS